MSAEHHRPERQARIQADMQNPEWLRRREMWRKAKGDKRERVAWWNVAWNKAGRPASFPDFAEWCEQQKAQRCRYGCTDRCFGGRACFKVAEVRHG